ncbi:hypothetical protein ABT065_28520 [Streptomyces sp. NPDC002764]|uniref:hypothetical protein n=1 Tax=Streptomyces sp. NPDC002764 TaxID=3154428 RepID=UPI0033176D29
MNALVNAVLSADQQHLLHTIAMPWIQTAEWPVWGVVQQHFDQRRLDADDLLQSLPRIGVTQLRAGYGFTTPQSAPLTDLSRVRLTAAASLVLPEMKMLVGEPFVRVIHHMVKLYVDRPVSTSAIHDVMLRSDELAAAMSSLKPWFLKALYDLLAHEPAMHGIGAIRTDGSWEWRKIDRSVLQFRDITSVEDYVLKTCEIVMGRETQFVARASASAPAVAVERNSYVYRGLLDDLEKASRTSTWKVHKLIALCRELNDNYAAGNPYACATLLRAVLDHIPPVFGHRDFKQVAAQHTFAVQRTDKAHAQKLVAFKDIADDALHRPISTTVPVLSMDDLPEPARVNSILQEVVRLL